MEGFRVQGSGFRVQGSGCRVQGAPPPAPRTREPASKRRGNNFKGLEFRYSHVLRKKRGEYLDSVGVSDEALALVDQRDDHALRRERQS
jgi:hypothetical protein